MKNPGQAFDKLAERQRLAQNGALIVAFSHGGMPRDLAKHNSTLLAGRVLPRLEALDGGGGLPLITIK